MKAVIFPQPGSIAYETIDDPDCAPDEVVIRVARSGICGTDLHIFRDEYESDFPLIPGHEFGGEIVEAGKGVTDLAIGDRVVVDPNLYCTRCDYCRDHQANHCANWQGIGVTRNGGFAEYVNVPARAAYQVRADFSDAQLAFVEPLACVIWALRRIHVNPADRVLIFGCGPMGLLLLQALQRAARPISRWWTRRLLGLIWRSASTPRIPFWPAARNPTRCVRLPRKVSISSSTRPACRP